ncbi:hypothetical protein BJL96_27730 [Burkholderia cenocepacia]|nr:hypothetical protein [Burkholderia cenocepacia]NGO98056.1 hypothetical protein [Burkholderia cenocepacia]
MTSGQLDTLKAFAFLAMVCDHVNKGLLHQAYPAMSLFGRFAFPLFAWCFAYSVVHHMRDTQRFVRTAAIGCIAVQWPFYQVLVPHGAAIRIGSLNILATFLFAFVINQISANRLLREFASPVVFIFGGVLCMGASYGWAGIGLILACIGFFRSGGVVYAGGCLGLLALCMIGSEVMVVPVVAVVLACSSVAGVAVRVPRFLPRNALYVSYVGHIWLLYFMVSLFH